MKQPMAVNVFACSDRNLHGFSRKADGSDLPRRTDGGLWVPIANIPLNLIELEKYTSQPAAVLSNVEARGFDVAPATAKILPFPSPHRHSA
jgi:hypothetical protein